MKMILNNNVEFLVDAIIHMGNSFEINFKEGVSYLDVQPTYDPVSPIFDKKALRKITLVNEETGEIEGVHLGYTEVTNISCLNNKVTILIEKENEVSTEVELLKNEVYTLQSQSVNTLSVNQQQDLLIMENDLRLMDLEILINEVAPSTETLALSGLGRSSSKDLLLRMILEENYLSKESMKANIDKYYDRKRISEEEYYELLWTLYPETKPMPLEAEVVKTEEEVTPKKRTRKKSK